METPQVSVIVPVYNAEKYISSQVDSILAQSYTDFELLLIDDGSTDSSPLILDKYAEKDNRIRVIHKKNGGVSSARNCGLDYAQGVFIAFADSDDYMFQDNLQTMTNEIGSLDLLICNFAGGIREHIGSCQRKSKKTWEIVANNEKEMFDVIPRIGYKNFVVWNQLFRRSIIEKHHIRFKNITNEDEPFSYTYFTHVSSLKRIDFEGVYYVDTPNSYGSSHKRIGEIDWINEMEVLLDKIIEKWHLKGRDVHTYNRRIANWLSVLCLKGYYKDSKMPWRKRMAIWESVRNDKWFKTRINPALMGRNIHIMLFIVKYRLYYLLDPVFQVYGLMNS